MPIPASLALAICKLSETFRLDTVPELGDGSTSNLESISQFACVELDIPSTDGTNNASVRLCPTHRLMKLVPAVRAREVQTHI